MTVRGLAVVLLPLALVGCAGLIGVHVDHAQTGEIVVRTGAPTSFDRIAERVYGDPRLGRSVAVLAHLPYEEGAPRGALLVLPPRDLLESRMRSEESSGRHFDRGLEAADAGSFRAAADHFRAALDEAPHRMDVRYNLGLALMQAGELGEATTVLEAVAAARPDDADSRYAFGSVLRRRRAYLRAYEEFEAALRVDSRHASAAFARAKTLEDLGQADRAVRAWEEFLREFPEDPLAMTARRNLEELRAADDP